MPIIQGRGNLLTADVHALVNTVNTEGVMGKGIALQFRKAWPAMFKDYEAACKRGDVTPGRMHVWETGQATGPRFIINFPTKRSWRSRSRLSDIESGLADLVHVIRSRGIKSIAIPPLGCGNGGLKWRDVESLIRGALKPLQEDVEVILFPPAGAPAAAEQITVEPRPNLTPGRAALLALMREYERTTLMPPSLIAVQKLAYFLQVGGQPLRLHFQAHRYGPYADSLRKTLRAMEGHFITGFGDGSSPVLDSENLQVMPEAEADLDRFIAANPETQYRVAKALRDIEGFESDYGLELLASVHWILTHDASARAGLAEAYERIRSWSSRKADLFTEKHVRIAWAALNERELVNT